MVKTPRVALISFGDGSLGFRKAGERLGLQAIHSGYFEDCQIYNSKLLEQTTALYKRGPTDARETGFGFWRWKPALLLATLRNLPKNIDVVCYVDAGCTINYSNPAAKVRFEEYCAMARRSHPTGKKMIFENLPQLLSITRLDKH